MPTKKTAKKATAPARKAVAKKAAAKATAKPASKAKATPVAKKPVAKKPTAKKPAPSPAASPKKPAPRADFGKPIDSFFDKQPPQLREILVALRSLVEASAPDATASIKWGMPFFQIGGNMFVALGAHKAHVNLILAGAPGTFDDPDDRLTGDGKTGRHLKLSTLSELPADQVRGWLATAANLARAT
jgi:hypothetical protein